MNLSWDKQSLKIEQKRFTFGNLIKTPIIDREAVPGNYRHPDTEIQVWCVPFTYTIYSNSTGKPMILARNSTDLSTVNYA